MNLLSQLPKIRLGAAWLLLNTSILSVSSVAAPVSPNDQIQQARLSSDWINLPGDPPPSGTGVRIPCDGEVVPLVPIFQQGDKKEKNYAGYTAQPLPTFRFYVPYKPEIIKSSEFVLRYPSGSIRTAIKITAPGIIQVSLPPNKIKELTVGQWYQAELQVAASCRKDKPPQSITSGFWVKRNLSAPLPSNLPPQQQIAFYRRERMWFEALSVAAKLEREKPGNRDWQELLGSAGLKGQANQPILDCCSPPQPASRTK